MGQSSGIVQVYYSSNGSSEWVNVCSGSTSTQANAGVICHQLGFTGAASYSTSGKEKYILYFTDVTLGTKIKNSFTKAVIGRIGCLSGHTYNAVKQKNISLCLKRRFYAKLTLIPKGNIFSHS